jgi:hypothetical protein
MSNLCSALKRELQELKAGPDERAFRDCRKQTRQFQLYREDFKKTLCPLLAVLPPQETEQWHEIERSLSSIQNHVLRLIEHTAAQQKPKNIARLFNGARKERSSILEKLKLENASLVSLMTGEHDIGEDRVSEMDKAGPDGALSRAMKSCWAHFSKIHRCVVLQPPLCECVRHISDLRLHRQEPDEQVVAQVIFHWGPKTQESPILHMQEATITCHESFMDHQATSQSTPASR